MLLLFSLSFAPVLALANAPDHKQECFTLFKRLRGAMRSAFEDRKLRTQVAWIRHQFWLPPKAKSSMIARTFVQAFANNLEIDDGAILMEAYKNARIEINPRSFSGLFQPNRPARDSVLIVLPSEYRYSEIERMARIHEATHAMFEQRLSATVRTIAQETGDASEFTAGNLREELENYLHEQLALSMEYYYLKLIDPKRLQRLIQTVRRHPTMNSADKKSCTRTLELTLQTDNLRGYLRALHARGVYGRDYFDNQHH